MFKSTFCSYLHIIKTACPIKFEKQVFSQFMVIGPGPWIMRSNATTGARAKNEDSSMPEIKHLD